MKRKQGRKGLEYFRRDARPGCLSLHPFYLFHPALLVVSGYFMVGWPLPLLLKGVMFAAVCFVSVWLFYKRMMGSSSKTIEFQSKKSALDKGRKTTLLFAVSLGSTVPEPNGFVI